MSVYLNREELHFSGISSYKDTSFVAGRVLIWGEAAHGNVRDTSIICILDDASPPFTGETALKSKPAALVISSYALSQPLLSLVSSSAIPFIILREAPQSLYFQEGKVALLDTKRSVLIVDPSIETLNRYPQNPELDALPDTPFCDLKLQREQSKNKFLIEAPFPVDLFDTLTDFSERLGAPPVTLALSVPRSKQDEELFCENTEALFRSAVYGDVSVMITDFLTDTDISYAFSLMHAVFCRLEQEEREFNGYVKKGLLISSPSQLMRRARLHRPDFLCFDLDTLLCRIFGCPPKQLRYSDIRDELSEIWKRYLSDIAPDCIFTAKCNELGNSDLLRDFISFARIRDVYIVKN